MKLNKTHSLIALVIVTAVTIGGVIATKQPASKNETINVPSKSTVAVPEPDASDIEQIATYNIPTRAAAGSFSHAIYTDYSATEAKGYLTYDKDPNNPASFTVIKDANGQWQVTDYSVFGEPNL